MSRLFEYKMSLKTEHDNHLIFVQSSIPIPEQALSVAGGIMIGAYSETTLELMLPTKRVEIKGEHLNRPESAL